MLIIVELELIEPAHSRFYILLWCNRKTGIWLFFLSKNKGRFAPDEYCIAIFKMSHLFFCTLADFDTDVSLKGRFIGKATE